MTTAIARRSRQAFFWIGLGPTILTLVSFSAVIQNRAHQRRVTHTMEVLASIDQFRLALSMMWTGSLITPAAEDELAPLYRTNRALAEESLEKLRAQTLDNPDQQDRLRAVARLLGTLEQEYQRYPGAARRAPEVGSELRVALDVLLVQLRTTESALLRERLDVQSQNEALLLALYAIALAVNVWIVVWGYRLTRQHQIERAAIESVIRGENLELSGNVREVTELNHLLEAQVEERTRDLARTVVLLQRSNTELERFAYIASHDLQEPVRQVGSYVSLIDRKYRGLVDAEGRRYLDFAIGGAKRMQALINDLLEYSSLGSTPLLLEPIPLDDLVTRVLDRIDTKGYDATFRYENLPIVVADLIRLERVFEAFFSNALRFRHPERPLDVYIVGIESRTDWTVRIEDNGIGLNPNYARKIFEVFGRLNSLGKYPGTGMGLAIVKRIIEDHGGTVSVTGVPGEGATFSFTLPKVDLPEGLNTT